MQTRRCRALMQTTDARTRTCKKCGEEKPLTREFYTVDRYQREGFKFRCKPCTYEATNRWRAANPDKVREWQITGTATRHGLPRTRYDELRAAGCSACGAHEQLVVDHDHSCCPATYSCGSCVRGMLCQGCNTAIGMVGEDPARLEALASYLRQDHQ